MGGERKERREERLFVQERKEWLEFRVSVFDCGEERHCVIVFFGEI